MPLVLADRVRDTTTTTGTGTVTLSGTAPTGYQNFSVIGNGNTTYYTINAGSQWEVGIGTYSSSGPTLARNTVLESSNANALVDFAAGTKDVFVTYPSDRSVYQDGASIAAGTAVLPVANGGTGVTTSTGTGSVVLSTSPTLVTPTLGAASATSIAAALGTVSVPSYTFTGDLNTGIYSPAADTLAFAEGGVEVMRITSAGDVGIGTTSPLGRLAVASATGNVGFNTGTSSSPERGNLWYDTDGTGWVFNIGKRQSGTFTSQITILDNGNVGIGTTSPGHKLDVVGADGIIGIIRGATNALRFNVNSTGSNVEGVDITGVGSYQPLNIGGSIITMTTNGSERMRITSAGNVGIGTTSPGAKLDVRGVAQFFSGSTGSFNFIDVGRTTSEARMAVAASSGDFISGTAAGDAIFYNPTAANAWFGAAGAGAAIFATNNLERMRITSAGNVGIGTSAPSTTLDVASAALTPFILRSSQADVYQQFANSGNASGFIGYTGSSLTFWTGPERMRIDGSGNVGIGTSAPAGRVHAVNSYTNTSDATYIADGNIPGLNLRTSAGGRFSLFANYAAANTSSIVLGTGTSNPSTEAMRFDHATGNVGIGAITPTLQFQVGSRGGMDSSGVFYWGQALTGNNRGFLSWDTNIASINALQNLVLGVNGERMRITSAGNVGIGTTAPTTKLTVSDGAVTAGASGDVLVGRFSSAFPTPGAGYFRLRTNNIDGSNGGITIDTLASNTLTERMRITAAGDVGIGTSSPTRRLSVAGTSNAYMDFSASSFRRYTMGSESLGFVLFDDTASAYRMVINASGNVGIGTDSPSERLNVSGNILATGNVTAYSDIRLKDNVEQIDGALERVAAIRGVTYTRNDLEDKERRYAGVIAQELEQVLPEAVSQSGDMKAVDYNATIGLLIEAIKELTARVAQLEGTKP